jgi:uncharacterized membrane protein
VGFLGFSAPVVWDPSDYNTPIPLDASYASSFPKSINTSGVIVGEGYSADYQTSYALLWSPADGYSAATPLGGLATGALARSINDLGGVAGSGYDAAGTSWAMVWDPADYTSPVLLGGGFENGSNAHAINDSGRVAGGGLLAASVARACVWDPSDYATPVLLGDLGFGSQAYSINDAGFVAGMVYSNASSEYLPAVRSPADYSAPLILPGSPASHYGGTGLVINDLGWVVGIELDSSWRQYGVVWIPDSPAVPEPALA